MNIALIPNPNKPDAMAAARQLLHILGATDTVTLIPGPTTADIARANPDLAVVLGGDGSILSAVQVFGVMRIPVVGINFGKLGYLAAFSLDNFLEHRELITSGRAPRTQRLMLEGALYSWDGHNGIQSLAAIGALTPHASGIALNDVVINSGDPFRMIDLEVQINEERTTTFRSDGVIVSTASGSTGYNLSAGGPLVSPGLEAMVLTPICPHSLSFRPVVLPAATTVVICPHRLNPGSKLSFDGQITHPIRVDQCAVIRRSAVVLTLVENPSISHWQMLAQKLHWARSPRNQAGSS